jgi:glycosyltransferase involved in cell wall biosynthesis
MGRITYQKAPWKFAELASSLEDVADFIWIGDGSLMDRAKWFGDAPVHVTGWLSIRDVVSELQSASLFVLPSLWEGMPLALIEAQCLGLPAVASNIVGNRDVILNGETGYVVEDDDELLDRVTELISDVPLRREMSKNAVRQRNRFAHERLGKETLDIYERLLDEC